MKRTTNSLGRKLNRLKMWAYHDFRSAFILADTIVMLLMVGFAMIIVLSTQYHASTITPTNEVVALPDPTAELLEMTTFDEIMYEKLFQERVDPPLIAKDISETVELPGEEPTETTTEEITETQETPEEEIQEEPEAVPDEETEEAVEENSESEEEAEPEPEDEEIEYRYYMQNSEEFENFVRVVEAEVTGTDPAPGVTPEEAYNSKLRVAQVILNRVESEQFPNTVNDVIFQHGAFSPLLDGRYWEVEICTMTREACWAAIKADTPDMTSGCEYFSAHTDYCKYGELIFTDSADISYFKGYL